MIRQAVASDGAALESFLVRCSSTSMFLRSNLMAHGIAGANRPHATMLFLYPAAGPIRAVLGLSESDFRMNHVEPLFRLDLADLPQGAGYNRPARSAGAELLAGWFAAYMQETGLGQGDPALGIAEANDRVQTALDGGPRRLLDDAEDRPLAMAALNPRAGDSVQVGGVFVQPENRGRGLGRAVTRPLLAQARDRGAREAILFSNSDAATRAYRSIGFRQVGQYRIAFLHRPTQVPA